MRALRCWYRIFVWLQHTMKHLHTIKVSNNNYLRNICLYSDYNSLHSVSVMRNGGFCTTHSRWLVHHPLVFSSFVHSFQKTEVWKKCSGLTVARHEKTAYSQRGVSVRCSWGAARLSSQIGGAMAKDLQFWEKVVSASC